MLSPGTKRASLTGRLLLSSALVAASLAYGWWLQIGRERPVLATAPPPPLRAPTRIVPVPPVSAMMPRAPMAYTEPGKQHADADAGSGVKDAPGPVVAAAQPQKSPVIARPQIVTTFPAHSVPEAQPPQNNDLPSPSPPSSLTSQQALQMNLPTDGASPQFTLVTGSPEPGVMAPVPAGMHLADGDHVSDRHRLMWGDLRVRISIQGGVITGVQVLQFPDHRSQSLYLSQMALPILESEVIKSQKSQVDIVSSATDTSYTFQDAIADAITKATRG